MRIRTAFTRAALAAAVLATPALAAAQSLTLPDTSGYLVSGIAATQGQPGAQQRSRPGTGGIGIGVKGGLLFSSFREARADYKNNTGWQGTLFLGGNRSGSLGIMTELTYAKKGAKAASLATDTYYLEIPLLLRQNLGSDNKDTGAILYFIAGPAADILLEAKLSGIDIKDNFKDVDWNFVGGVGIEVSRIIVEGRFNWGLSNVLEGPGNALKTRSFAVLGGIRLN